MSDDGALPDIKADAGTVPGADAQSTAHAFGEIPLCCVQTIRAHVRFNPMMVCSACKNIIKCFREEGAFQNYLTFCRSRRRPVLMGVVDEHHTVAFRSYDTSFARGPSVR